MRIIWVIRHAEREDNINQNWQSLPEAKGLGRDNSMLSARGRIQAKECADRFADVNIAHLFASPYDRTIETATYIAEGKGLLIKPEAGLCEVLTECHHPPLFWDTSQLKKKFPLVDTDYKPVYTKDTMPPELEGDESCIPRVRRTLREIIQKYDGDLLLVSHGAPVGAIHQVWGGSFTYVGQATVSKFVEKEKGVVDLQYSSDCSHLSDKSNLRPF
ncbi:unnamed protein product [Nippostrongylus brasiliensis]|uniref:Histidine phosphatase family protein n=1 Tax=Nippostrongylus brasiliensis TaxID=27835 RepID=A0A0N4Y9V5_NIPBR|nr:unnamed protein product [Nippostrongylus brasiliensis]